MGKLPVRSSFEKGQALLLVLLSMAVILTVVLSILSRSVTDIAITSRSEESLRAFSAAEAGVERALLIGSDIGETPLGEAEFEANVSGFASGEREYAYPINLLSGESMAVWFVSHDQNNNFVCDADNPCFSGSTMRLCWGQVGATTPPAIEFSLFYAVTPGDYSTVQVARAAYDPDSSRRATNNFAAPDAGTCSVGGKTFAHQKQIDLTTLGVPSSSYANDGGLLFAKLKPLYNTAEPQGLGLDVDFAGNDLLPAQGDRIVSTGTSGEANRKLEVFRAFGEAPPIFDSAIFNVGGIVK